MFAVHSNLSSTFRGASFPLCSLKGGFLPLLPLVLGYSGALTKYAAWRQF